MIGRSYCIVRNHRGKDDEWEKIVEPGLDWETARTREAEMQKAENAAHPERTCWVKDIFWILMEGSDRYKDLLAKNAQGALF